MTAEEKKALQPGDVVQVRRDNGAVEEREVKYAPWAIGGGPCLGGGTWVIGLKGITGGYLLSRVFAKVSPPQATRRTS